MKIVYLICVGIIALATRARAGEYVVQIDTSMVQGTAGALAFDLVSDSSSNNHVAILDFTHNGTTLLPQTQGGLVEGDLILLANPAHHTEINDDSFYNQMLVPFSSFGTTITFSVHLTTAVSGPGKLPDEFSFYILGASGEPLFSTVDPLGANALIAEWVDGTPEGQATVFAPAILTAPHLVSIQIPGTNGDADGDGVLDVTDTCLGTSKGAIVNAQGCSIEQLCPCSGPASGGSWPAHGPYVACVKNAIRDFLLALLLTPQEARAIASDAVHSDCGHH
jgi:hypothetical protein